MKKLKSIITLPLTTVVLLLSFIVIISAYKNNIIIYLIYVSILFLLLILFIISKNYRFAFYSLYILIIFTLFFLRISKKISFYKEVINSYNDITDIIGNVVSFPENKDDKLAFILKVNAVKYKNSSVYKKIKPFRILIKIKLNGEKDIERGEILKIDKKILIPREKIFNFNYRYYLFCKNIYGVIYINKINESEIINLNNKQYITLFLKNKLWSKRKIFLSKIKAGLSNKTYAFIISIFFGMRNELSVDTYKEFCNTGLIHLLAISGLHIGFIGLLFYKIFKLILSKSKSLFLSVMILLTYILIINPSASSMRAFIMYTIYAMYFILGLKSKSLSILSYSAIILMFANPFIIYDLGFQFSFLATLGIMLFGNIIKAKLPEIIPDKIRSLFSVTLSAFLSLSILQSAKFNMIPVFSIISSVFMVPLFGLLFSFFFILLIIYYIINLKFILIIIDKLSYIFLKIVNILNFIPYIRTPDIPDIIAYLSIPILLIFFYIINPYLIKIINKLKLSQVNKLINSKNK